MEKRTVLLICMLTLSPLPLMASSDLATRARLAVAGIIGGCVGYEVYTRYSQFPVESPSHEENSPVEEEIDQNLLTLTERAKYFGRGVGYSLLTAGSVLAIYKCIFLALDRIDADPIKERHGMFDRNGWAKSGTDWEKLLAEGYKERNSYRAAGAMMGSLALAIPFFAYYKYRFPHNAVENFKKAFRR